MYPRFGESNIYFRVRRAMKEALRRSLGKIRGLKAPRPTLGKVWLRLSYFENRLLMLDNDSQEIFIENFYHSVRQVNYITMLTVLVIIGSYLTTFQFGVIGFWEGIAIEAILAFTLFYIVWYYRMGMEDLIDYLIRHETVPDYAFRPRLDPAVPEKPLKAGTRKIRGRKAKRR